MEITFCGANQEVTGSCYFIRTAQAQVLVDCGIFQGSRIAEEKNEAPFQFDPRAIEAVVLTHAHFDHCGRIPKLYKEGFRGRIYCTAPTRELAMITLRDAVHLMAEEAEDHNQEPLYTQDDVEPLENMFTDLGYHQECEIAPGIKVFLTDAGHILGSASVHLSAEGKNVAFSGDLGNSPVPLLHTTECIREADIVIIESTYGNRLHEPVHSRIDFLEHAINHTVSVGGTLLIPAFALERTQELIYDLKHLNSNGDITSLPVYLDSPMGIRATDVFERYSSFFNSEAQHDIQTQGNLFSFPGLHITLDAQESKAIARVKGPKTIIAGSGMMNGGRILHHIRNYISMPTTTLLIIGYQVEGSLGRRLHDGERNIRVYGQELKVKAHIASCGAFSGHADYPRLIQWLRCFEHQPPQKVFVTHGEVKRSEAFAESVTNMMGLNASVPVFGESVQL